MDGRKQFCFRTVYLTQHVLAEKAKELAARKNTLSNFINHYVHAFARPDPVDLIFNVHQQGVNLKPTLIFALREKTN